MKILSLRVDRRDDVGKRASKDLRVEGLVPGIVYGSGMEHEYIVLDEHGLRMFLKDAGEHAIVELNIENRPPLLAVLAEVQHHPVTDRVLHVDFKHIPKDQPVEISVPVEFVGESPGVHAGGLMIPSLYEFSIKTVPQNVPDIISVDVGGLDFDSAIHIADIEIPGGIEILHDSDQTVVTVVKPRVVEEEVVEEEEIEVPEAGEAVEGEEEEERQKE